MFGRSLLFIPLLLSIGFVSRAQFGGNPPSVKWNQVNIPAARIIFPKGMDSVGLNVAYIISRMNGAVRPTISTKQRQISILLQNQTLASNGYVQLAPFKSEFYLTPTQNSFALGSLPFYQQLAIHEFRHVQQNNAFDVGLSRVLHILFGESGQELGNTAAIPDWFYEGDAVYNETLVSNQGRGRLPWFFNGFRGIWEAGKDYSWMKLRNGSFVDYVPDWYPLGYMLTAYGREKYGSSFWRDVTHDAAAYKTLFYPFQGALKKHAGISFKQFRSEALDHFKKEIVGDNKTGGPGFKSNQHFIADVEYPAIVDDSTILYMKSTYRNRPAFVINRNGLEKRIAVRDISLDKYFDYAKGKIIYSSYQPDVRWSNQEYNDLKVVNISTGEERKITHHTRYFSPAFSNDGSRVVAVAVAANGRYQLHILDAINGKVVQQVNNPENVFFTYPKFYGQDKIVSAIRYTNGKMSIALVDIATGKISELTKPDIAPVGFTHIYKDTVYFTATAGKNDRLDALSIPDKKLFLLQNDTLLNAIGNYQPTISDNKLAWVSFTAYGYQLHTTKHSQLKMLPVANGFTGSLQDYGITNLKSDSSADLLAKVQPQPLPITKYSKLHNFFNFHSLIPDFSDPNYTLSLEGENVLNTFRSSIYGTYNRNEGYKEVGYNATYGGLFPYITGGADAVYDRRSFFRGENIYYNEYQVHGGLAVPLNLGSAGHSTNLTIGSNIVYDKTSFQEAFRSRFRDASYTYLSNYLSFSNSIQQAVQNIYPHFAQNISLSFKKGIIDATSFQFLATGNFYFPGFWANHNLVIGAAHQLNSQNSVINYANNFPFSRGYTVYNLHQMDKIAANYHFPIVYPDAGFGNLIYLLRLRGNIFYDYTRAQDYYTNGTVYNGDFRSTGAELFFDTKLFNELPFTIGLRYVRLLDQDLGSRGNNRFEVVVPVSIF
ncbi:TolB family protein [Mucilaginibacter ginkgonis]|uniref:WD40 repeat protein n=1 Tax=Mucilaginibacter ginkgonis TaxID=2682091 RepID=A0A6I4I6J5_9SPHI|nr:hypothetical protein [Mucilaginibacter ginkgonis]QQL50644.1 hypothetical protein GO620_004080 [Mucilaginibacter ginkgonis]